MSLPDYLLEDDEMHCFTHDIDFKGFDCPECRQDRIDLYSDMKIQDQKEGK